MTFEYTAADIADRIGGEVVGNPDVRITNLCSLQHAGPGSVTFVYDEKNLARCKPDADAVVIAMRTVSNVLSGTRIIVADPHLAYARVSRLFIDVTQRPPFNEGVHDTAVVADSVQLGEGVSIGPCAVVLENVCLGAGVAIGAHTSIGPGSEIGAHSVLNDHISVFAGTRIGERCEVSSGTVIGASGFGFAWDRDAQRWERIEQLGRVTIGNDVEIGAGCTIDRGAIDDTVIEDGVKMDNQVMIAHNVRVGANSILAGCVAIAGSTVVGQRCRFGGRSSVLGQLEICDDVIIHALTTVTRSIRQSGDYSSVISAKPAPKWRTTLRALDRIAREKK
ncbi:MAG: UDP-3-O-(3-hydroxymyristoyl)glucosamine N-acyltransferase [Pseudomonadota bacterium]